MNESVVEVSGALECSIDIGFNVYMSRRDGKGTSRAIRISL